MSYRGKLALINGSIWFVMFVLFCVSFFTSTYLSVLPLSNYRLTTSMIFGLANISNIVFLILISKKEKTDERNKKIEFITGSVTLISIMIIVYLTSIILYVVYEGDGMVPVSWLWFLSYGSVFMVFIIFNFSYALVSLKGTGYED